MMFSAPSFLAAATRASIPPTSAADFALPAATVPPDEAAAEPELVVPVLLGGAQAETASAAPTTRPESRARRVVVTFLPPVDRRSESTSNRSVDVRSFGVMPSVGKQRTVSDRWPGNENMSTFG